MKNLAFYPCDGKLKIKGIGCNREEKNKRRD